MLSYNEVSNMKATDNYIMFIIIISWLIYSVIHNISDSYSKN